MTIESMTVEQRRRISALKSLIMAVSEYDPNKAKTDVIGHAIQFSHIKKREEFEALLTMNVGDLLPLYREKYKPRKKS